MLEIVMAKRALPSLTALRSFEAAARHHSFRRAAEELGITQSAISHQVAALEEALKVTLFRRVSRGIELTEAGAQFYPYLRDGFDRIAQGASLVSRAELGGDLTVQVYVTVAVRWLIPRIHLFQARHPGILVRFHTRDFHWEFDPAFADIGMISTTKPDNPDLAYAHLFDAKLIPVCTPGIAQAGMGLRQPADLVNHALLQVYTAVEDWHVWLDAAGVPQLKGRSAAKYDSYLLAIEAAIDGQGVALVPHFLAAPDIKSGRLTQPFAIDVMQPARWYLTCLKERAQEPRIRRFREWLIDLVAEDPVINPHAPLPGLTRQSGAA
jgi:LysR family transcriptional regulator, glycine cleavage system transcriptional activator